MKLLNNILKVIKSKYFIAFVIFAAFMLFYDKNDIFVQLQKQQEIKELRKSQSFYEKEVQSLRNELTELENNPEKLNTYARENLFMKKANEDIFIMEPVVDTMAKK